MSALTPSKKHWQSSRSAIQVGIPPYLWQTSANKKWMPLRTHFQVSWRVCIVCNVFKVVALANWSCSKWPYFLFSYSLLYLIYQKLIIFQKPLVWPSRQASKYGFELLHELLHEGLGRLLTECLCVQNVCQRSLDLTIYLKFKTAASLWLTRREAPLAAFDAEFERNGYVFQVLVFIL